MEFIKRNAHSPKATIALNVREELPHACCPRLTNGSGTTFGNTWRSRALQDETDHDDREQIALSGPRDVPAVNAPYIQETVLDIF